MTLHELGNRARAAWRPLIGYTFAPAMIVGLFVPSVTAEKLLVMAGVLTALGWLRSQDKKTETGQ